MAIARLAPKAAGAAAAAVAIVTDRLEWLGDADPDGFSALIGPTSSPEQAVRSAIASGEPVTFTTVRGHHATAFPVEERSGLTAVIAFEWSGNTRPHTARVNEVVTLCAAALIRAWATRRTRELGAVMGALLEQAPIGFAFIDTELRYVHLNQQLADFNGDTVSAHRQRTVREMLPNLADQLEPVLRSVIETGIPTDRIEVVGETPAATGETHTFEAAYLPVTLDDDEVVGVAVVVEDVTEQRRHLSDLRERYDHEREVAARLQQGLLPRNLPQPAGYEVAVRYIAGSEGLRIGGDWYDLIELGADRYAVVIGDVVGHGLDAAIAMTRVRHALVGLGHAVADPVKVLDRLDEYAVEDQDRYVATLTYGLLEPSSGSIRLSSAGHPPPLLVSSAGRVGVVHEGRGTPIGITAKPRAATTVSLDLGDTFVLYTDGVLGQRGTSVDAGIGRLTQVASSWTGSLEELANDIVALRPASEQIDDIALLILRRQTAS